MKYRILIFVLPAVFLLASCTKMQMVKAPLEKPELNIVNHARYDAASKIRYMVSNDNERVYLHFDTDNRNTMMRIRKTGAIVRFDTQGKKKGKTWLKYPIYGEDQVMQDKMEDEVGNPGVFGLRNLFPPATTAMWQEGETTRSIDLAADAEGLMCSATIDSVGTLVYRVGVPFTMLGGTKPEDFPKLSMCLEIPNPDGPKASGSNPMPSTMNSNANSMPGGANSGLPGPNGGMTGGSVATGGVSPANPTYKVWMSVALHPSEKL